MTSKHDHNAQALEICDHLFIAMVGNVGSGVTTSSETIKDLLESQYAYKVTILRISSLIEESSLGRHRNLTQLEPDDKVDAYQTCGNDLRKHFGDDYLARRAIDYSLKNLGPETRQAFIFDSFKHPAEIDVLKKAFEERLITFTVFSPARIRKQRLIRKGNSPKVIDGIFDRDEFELERHGQKVRETAYLSDFFVRNSQENKSSLRSTISRYLEIIFRSKIHSPTADESGMAKAFGAAANSACLSRQVGAAVYDQNGKLLATGCNDVPKFGGGLYNEDLGDGDDHRCFNWQDGHCHNDFEKNAIYQELVASIVPPRLGKKNDGFKDEIVRRIKMTRVKDLIEFSRSVHAEMDAIVSVSRHGTGSTINGTLYSKTFPCHNCARHIVAAGIKRVVFVEPYPKSLALKLHSDSITVRDEDQDDHVFFVQYEGVSPKVFPRYFNVEASRKAGGKVEKIDPTTARPIGVPESQSYLMEARRLAAQSIEPNELR